MKRSSILSLVLVAGASLLLFVVSPGAATRSLAQAVAPEAKAAARKIGRTHLRRPREDPAFVALAHAVQRTPLLLLETAGASRRGEGVDEAARVEAHARKIDTLLTECRSRSPEGSPGASQLDRLAPHFVTLFADLDAVARASDAATRAERAEAAARRLRGSGRPAAARVPLQPTLQLIKPKLRRGTP